MANPEESNPLLPSNSCKPADSIPTLKKPTTKKSVDDEEKGPRFVTGYGWTADGLPLGHGSVIGEPVKRTPWDSGLFGCLGRNDDFCGTDLEVCLLGAFVPCILHGTNAERLGNGPSAFASNFLKYTGLYVIGNCLLCTNWLAPLFSYPSRIAIRRRFNLEGNFEAFSRTYGCCESILVDDVQRERCESFCDFATHYLCHSCSLCQEGRELRHRLPHPWLNNRPVIMIPPTEQSMGRDGK